MTHGGTRSEADDVRDGWSLAQLARLAEAVGDLARSVQDRLDDLDPDELRMEGGATLTPERLDGVLDDVCALRDAAEQAGMIGGSIRPRDRELEVDLDGLAEAAARSLIEGAAEIWMVELAIRMLEREQGFPALADAIEMDPLGVVKGWGETTVGLLLDAFREVDPGRTAWICQAAHVRAEDKWTDLDADALARVCAALREAAKYA